MMSLNFVFDSSKIKSLIECFKDNNSKSYSCAKNWSMKALSKTL